MEEELTIQAAGVDFHVRQQGDKPSAIFLHGFGDNLHTWDNLILALGQQFSTLRYDLRGFGQSSCQCASQSEQPFSHSDDLLAILDALGIEQCTLVGVSMGGGVALNFALNYPQRVAKLILISPALVAWEWSTDWQALWQALVAHARAGEMDKARTLWWQHPVFASTRASPAAAVLFESIMAYSGAQWVRDYQRHELPDIERLFQLRAPTLLLSGGRDMEDFHLIADIIAASVADLSRVNFPALGHLLHLEDPGCCASEMLSFLTVNQSMKRLPLSEGGG